MTSIDDDAAEKFIHDKALMMDYVRTTKFKLVGSGWNGFKIGCGGV